MEEKPKTVGDYSRIRDRSIIRQTCIKAAAEFCASKANAGSDTVTKVAAEFEKWVLREEDG
jgi:hypothetical protein